MPSRQKIAGGDPDRIAEALDRAIDSAERGDTTRPVTLVRPEDIRALPLADLRSGSTESCSLRSPTSGSTRCSRPACSTRCFPRCSAWSASATASGATRTSGSTRSRSCGRRCPARGALGRALPRHRQGQDALVRPGTARCTSSATPRSAPRMFDKLDRRERLLRRGRRSDDLRALLDPASPAREPVRRPWTDSAVRRFAREMGGHLDDLALPDARRHHHQAPRRRSAGHRADQRALGAHRASSPPRTPKSPLPKGVGNAIMEHFGLRRRAGSARSSARSRPPSKLARSRRSRSRSFTWSF